MIGDLCHLYSNEMNCDDFFFVICFRIHLVYISYECVKNLNYTNYKKYDTNIQHPQIKKNIKHKTIKF